MMVRIGMRCVLFVLVAVLLAGIGVSAAQTLDIYFIDVEGGQATLIVTPGRLSIKLCFETTSEGSLKSGLKHGVELR